MKIVKNILFYFVLTLALAGYISYEFSDSLLSSGIKPEALDNQAESESKECEEKTHTEEYENNYSPELKNFFFPKQEQYCFLSHFIPIDYTSLVWIPPKLS